MSRTALVAAADFNESYFRTNTYDYLVAVDGGYAHVDKAGFVPQIAVGDFDSLGFVPDTCRTEVVPCEKDFSDLQLAIEVARKNGADKLDIYGALSQRFDHTLATIQVMVAAARSGLEVVGIGDGFKLFVLDGDNLNHLTVRSTQSDGASATDLYRNYISVFAYGGNAQGVCERGLAYRLDDAALEDDCSLGLSNQMKGDEATVSLVRGNLIVTVPIGYETQLTAAR